MLPSRTDVLNAVRKRTWTIQEAWALVDSSRASALHPHVHVRLPELHAAAESHYLTSTDYSGREYRDRGRHSLFRNAWEAAGAICAAMNSPAGEAALELLPRGQVELRSRSALIGVSKQLQRLQLEYQGATTGVSYFDMPVDHVFLLLVSRDNRVGLKTAYPVSETHPLLLPGRDLVRQGGSVSTYVSRIF
jgi:hypothetical protein